MAYFSNGNEGESFSDQCYDCPMGHGWNDPNQGDLFDRETQPRPCPVALVQLRYNYSQVRGRGCDAVANHLEESDTPQLIEEENGIGFGNSETQVKVAIEHLRSDDFRDALNCLVDASGVCQVRKQLQEIRRTDA